MCFEYRQRMPLWKIGPRFEVINSEDGKQFHWWAGAAEIAGKSERCVITRLPGLTGKLSSHLQWFSPISPEDRLLETFIQSSFSSYSSIHGRSPPTRLWGSRCLNPTYKNDNSRKLFPGCKSFREVRGLSFFFFFFFRSVAALVHTLSGSMCSSESESCVWKLRV